MLPKAKCCCEENEESCSCDPPDTLYATLHSNCSSIDDAEFTLSYALEGDLHVWEGDGTLCGFSVTLRLVCQDNFGTCDCDFAECTGGWVLILSLLGLSNGDTCVFETVPGCHCPLSGSTNSPVNLEYDVISTCDHDFLGVLNLCQCCGCPGGSDGWISATVTE